MDVRRLLHFPISTSYQLLWPSQVSTTIQYPSVYRVARFPQSQVAIPLHTSALHCSSSASPFLLTNFFSDLRLTRITMMGPPSDVFYSPPLFPASPAVVFPRFTIALRATRLPAPPCHATTTPSLQPTPRIFTQAKKSPWFFRGGHLACYS